jgi:hypothetical protein
MTGEEAVAESIEFLREQLSLQTTTLASHQVIVVSGCDSPDAICHIGRFLVGAVAQAVRTDLQLQPALIGQGRDGQNELERDIAKIIGEADTDLSDHARTHTRDPWIGEALGHLMLVLSDRVPHPCAPAPIVASHLPHVEAREHGLDLFAFCHPDLMVVIGEAKTSKSGIASGLADAEGMLTAIERGERDHHVRQAVNGLLLSLSDEAQQQAVGTFWKSARCYLPVLCFQEGITLSDERAALRALTDAAADCRLVAIQHEDHDKFFADVAVAMREAVPTISPD